MLNLAHCIGTLHNKQRSPIYEMFGSETRQWHIDSNVLRYIAHLSGIGLQMFQVYYDLCLRAQLKKIANQGSFFLFLLFYLERIRYTSVTVNRHFRLRQKLRLKKI